MVADPPGILVLLLSFCQGRVTKSVVIQQEERCCLAKTRLFLVAGTDASGNFGRKCGCPGLPGNPELKTVMRLKHEIHAQGYSQCILGKTVWLSNQLAPI